MKEFGTSNQFYTPKYQLHYKLRKSHKTRRIEREWAGLIRPQTFPYEWNVCGYYYCSSVGKLLNRGDVACLPPFLMLFFC